MKFVPTIGDQLSGSAGGITASRNRYGPYFRRRSLPVNPNTNRQERVRTTFGEVSGSWRTIAPEARQGWSDYAANTPVSGRTGRTNTLGGNAMLSRCLAPRAQAGVPWDPTSPPTTAGLATLSRPTAVSIDDTGTMGFTIDPTDGWASAVGGFLFVFVSRPLSAGVAFFKGPYRFVGSVAGAATPIAANRTLSLAAAGFTFAAGDGAGVRFIASDSQGRLSDEVRQLLVVAAA